MTPVATPVALRAHTWDAALEETLSGGSDAPALGVAADARHASVHSVHGRVVNVRWGALLIALAHEDLDDAPWTIRIEQGGWNAVLSARAGDEVTLAPDAVVLHGSGDEVGIVLAPEGARALRAASDIPATKSLRLAVSVLDGVPSPAAVTPFGALAADVLAAGIRRLNDSARTLLRQKQGDAGAEITAAAERLLGLGEGLTPSGDDVLTGLAFVAAHPGFGLTPLVPSLRAAVAGAGRRTTQLSEVTLRAALNGRARRRMHDLVQAVIDGDGAALRAAVSRTAEIGHTSGFDILTGIRLSFELALAVPARGWVRAAITRKKEETS